MFARVAILGPGLLGSSLGRAVKAYGLAGAVSVWARRPESRVAAEAEPWCDAVSADPAEAAAGADLVVVCTPVTSILPLLERAASGIAAGALVTDVGSTKSLICRHGRALMPTAAHFIGSHPMAGSEKTGMAHGRAELFDGAACLVTPLPEDPEPEVERLLRFWAALGMRVRTVSPERHDEIVANISHLPHLLASALCAHLADNDADWREFGGNGLRDTTRVAAGDPGLWREIVSHNREEILRALQAFENQLEHLRSLIANQQDSQLEALLAKGKTYRDQLP